MMPTAFLARFEALYFGYAEVGRARQGLCSVSIIQLGEVLTKPGKAEFAYVIVADSVNKAEPHRSTDLILA